MKGEEAFQSPTCENFVKALVVQTLVLPLSGATSCPL